MKKLVAALVCTAGLTSCGYAQCTALCIPSVELTLLDAQGAAVTPGSGTVTFAGQTGAFDCANNQLSPVGDGGTLVQVRCANNKLTISEGPMPSELELTVHSASGNLQFSGTVQQLSYQDTGESICGTRCRVASKTVTLR